jgi:shikimate dehydrogenase
MALKAARLNAVYVALEPASLAGLLSLADDENYRGFSVTAPFKEEARRLAVRADAASESCGAANTLVREGSAWRAANTDVPAVRDTLARAFELHARTPGRPKAPAAAHTLILGAGGAARAAAWALRSQDARVTIAARDPARAEALALAFGCESCAWSDAHRVPYDALVHATPLGSALSAATKDRMPIPAEWIRPGSLVLDAVYRPIKTPLLAEAARRGCTAVPGAEWFVRQAVAQFRLFTNGEPNEPLMRAAFEHALADGGEA